MSAPNGQQYQLIPSARHTTSLAIRHTKALAIAFCLLLASPSFAREGGEVQHHWEMPVYRTEMLTQIGIMTAVSVVVLGVLWLSRKVRLRRSGQ